MERNFAKLVDNFNNHGFLMIEDQLKLNREEEIKFINEDGIEVILEGRNRIIENVRLEKGFEKGKLSKLDKEMALDFAKGNLKLYKDILAEAKRGETTGLVLENTNYQNMIYATTLFDKYLTPRTSVELCEAIYKYNKVIEYLNEIDKLLNGDI